MLTRLRDIFNTFLRRTANTAQKTILSFPKCSEKMVFPKNRTGIWSFLCYQERWYFFLPKISSFSLDGKWKMIFLKKRHGNIIFSSNVLKRWSFQKNQTGIWSFLLYYLERWYYLFPKNMILFFRQKMKDDLSQKNTWKYDIFFKCPEKMVFPKIIALEYDLSCIIWKDVFFPRKYDIFSLNGKWKMIFLKNYTEIRYFLYICTNVTNMILPFWKKNQRWSSPEKIHLKTHSQVWDNFWQLKAL